MKSIGLVRIVHLSHGGRTIRYRHVAGQRSPLERNELAVLAMLMLRGPQTAGELRSRVDRVLEPDGPSVADALDTLTARSPEAFALKLERRPGEREQRWAHLLAGEIDEGSFAPPSPAASAPLPAPAPADDGRVGALEVELARLRRRLDRLEELLGVEAAEADGTTETGDSEPPTESGVW